MAAWYGGDEFVIMLREVEDSAMATAVAAKVRARLSEPHVIDGHEICMTASVGIALFPLHGIGCEQLIARADTAMYLAKASSGPAVIQAVLALPPPAVASAGPHGRDAWIHDDAPRSLQAELMP